MSRKNTNAGPRPGVRYRARSAGTVCLLPTAAGPTKVPASTGCSPMSLLRQGNQAVTVYPEELRIDSDGNKFTGPSNTGTTYRATVQPISSTENAEGGFNTITRYRLRLVNYPGILGAQSQIEWN